MHFVLHDIVQVATLEWRENRKKHGKSFRFHFHSKRKNASTSVFKRHFTQLRCCLGPTLAPRGACAYSWRYQLPLPLQVAFSDVSWKGRGGTFPQFELEMISKRYPLIGQSFTLGLLLNGGYYCIDVFLSYPGKKTIFGDVFFQVSRSWTAMLAKMRLAACGWYSGRLRVEVGSCHGSNCQEYQEGKKA